MTYEYKVVELSYPPRRHRPAGSTARTTTDLDRQSRDTREQKRRWWGRDDDANLSCSFCGKSQREVMKLIAGPTVYICDECIGLCNEIIAEEVAEEHDRDDAASTASREEAEERELNRLGADGWELVWVVSAMHETGPSRLYLKRPTQYGAS